MVVLYLYRGLTMFDINNEEGLILTPINNIFFPARYFPVGFNINQFNGEGGWSIGSYTPNGTLNVTAQMESDHPTLAGPFGICLSPDGTKLFSMELLDTTFFEYDLSTPYDITTATFITSVTVTPPGGSNLYGVDFSLDGTKLYTYATQADSLVQYNLSTAFDLTSINTTATATLDCSTQNVNYQALCISDDGTHILAGGVIRGDISSYIMSTPYDLSTATFKSRFVGPLWDEFNFVRGLDINDKGTKLAALSAGSGGAILRIYNMSTPYDVSTMTVSNVIQTPLESYGASVYNSYRGFHATNDFKNFYVATSKSPYTLFQFTRD